MNKIQSIIRKEWSEIFKNKMVLMITAFMPLLFSVLPLIILGTMGDSLSSSGMEEIPTEFAHLCAGLAGGECMQFFIISQFLVMFLLLPIMIPITIASYSIVGEKRTRTLEPLLATPMTTIELLAGKALAAVIPALIATVGSYAIFVIGTWIMMDSTALVAKLFSPLWLIGIFVLGPLMSIAGVSLAVMVSARVNDPRVAEQVSALVILPVMAIFMSQTAGLFQLDPELLGWITIATILIDIALLYFAVQIFQRENILTRWK